MVSAGAHTRRERRGGPGGDRPHAEPDRGLLRGVRLRQRGARHDRRAVRRPAVGPGAAGAADPAAAGAGRGPAASRSTPPPGAGTRSRSPRPPPAPRPTRPARRTAAARSPGPPRPRRPAGRSSSASCSLTVSRSPDSRRSAACRSATVFSSASRSSVSMPGCLAEVASTGAPSSPSSSSSRLRSASTISVSAADSRSAWFSTTMVMSRVRPELPQVRVVQDPVAVLLRVHHPDHLVDQAEQPVHLEPVAAFDRVEVGQVEQHQPAQRRLVVAVQRALPDEPLPGQHADPVEQPVGRLERAPDAGVRDAGGRPAHPDRRQLEPGQRVEQAGLAAAGAAGQRDHGVVLGELEPAAGPLHQRVRGDQVAVRQVRVDHAQEPGQRVQPVRPAARRRSGRRRRVSASRTFSTRLMAAAIAQGAGAAAVNASSPLARSTSAAACRSSRAGLELQADRGGAVRVPGRLRVEQLARPGTAGLREPGRPACGSPGRRRSPRAPSARRPWCPRRPRPRRRSG